jgi:hypothetical protein
MTDESWEIDRLDLADDLGRDPATPTSASTMS